MLSTDEGRYIGAVRINLSYLHMCHPERSEGSHAQTEMLPCTQHDKALPNYGVQVDAY
jgi:hypothetical protein